MICKVNVFSIYLCKKMCIVTCNDSSITIKDVKDY